MRSLKLKERRKSPRHGCSRLAKIDLGVGTELRYCLVTDISDGGVRLYVQGFELPDEFALFLSDGDGAHEGTYKVVWRLGHEVGAKLVRHT
jgi:PilZ domain